MQVSRVKPNPDPQRYEKITVSKLLYQNFIPSFENSADSDQLASVCAQLFACWVIVHAFFLSSADFFHNLLFQKIPSVALSESQAIWIQIRTDILSVLIWVKTVCKGYQQMTKPKPDPQRCDKITVLDLISTLCI